MGKETFIIYTSFYKPISFLSDKQLGRLFRAIFRYNLGEVVEVEDDIRMAFEFFKNQFDIDESKYQAKIMRDIENGRKGGNPNFKKGMPNPYRKKNKGDITDNKPPLLEITTDNPPLSEITQDKAIYDNVYDNDINIRGSDEPLCGTSPHAEERIDYKALVDFFNEETKGVFGFVRYPISEKRKGMVNARIRVHGKQAFADMVHRAYASDFLRGQNKGGFKATFDWLIKPTNFEKVISGNYDNRSIENIGNHTKSDDEDFMRNIAEGIARANYEKQRRRVDGEPVSGQ